MQDWAELWLCVKKFSDRLTLPTLLKTRVKVLTVHCELPAGLGLQGEAAFLMHSYRDAEPQPVIQKKIELG